MTLKERAKKPKPASTKPAPAAASRTAKKKPAVAKEGGPAPDAPTAAERIERRIAELGDWRGERLAEIRALIHEVDPDVVEEWKWMGTPVWSNRGMYALANPHKDKVKLTFFHGAKLADPDRLFNAGLAGGQWRAIDFRKDDPLDRLALARLLRAAIDYNAAHAVPKSRGSRR